MKHAMTTTATHPRTFTAYLRAQIHRKDAVGDLARDWVYDGRGKDQFQASKSGKPRGRYGLDAVLSYLSGCRACEGALIAARQAWYEWAGNPVISALRVAVPNLLIQRGFISESDADSPSVKSLASDIIHVVVENESR